MNKKRLKNTSSNIQDNVKEFTERGASQGLDILYCPLSSLSSPQAASLELALPPSRGGGKTLAPPYDRHWDVIVLCSGRDTASKTLMSLTSMMRRSVCYDTMDPSLSTKSFDPSGDLCIDSGKEQQSLKGPPQASSASDKKSRSHNQPIEHPLRFQKT